MRIPTSGGEEVTKAAGESARESLDQGPGPGKAPVFGRSGPPDAGLTAPPRRRLTNGTRTPGGTHLPAGSGPNRGVNRGTDSASGRPCDREPGEPGRRGDR